MSRDQNAGRSHDIMIDNSFFEGVEKFRYLGTALTDQNSIRKKQRADLNQGMLSFGAEYFVFQFAIQIYKEL